MATRYLIASLIAAGVVVTQAQAAMIHVPRSTAVAALGLSGDRSAIGSDLSGFRLRTVLPVAPLGSSLFQVAGKVAALVYGVPRGQDSVDL